MLAGTHDLPICRMGSNGCVVHNRARQVCPVPDSMIEGSEFAIDVTEGLHGRRAVEMNPLDDGQQKTIADSEKILVKSEKNLILKKETIAD